VGTTNDNKYLRDPTGNRRFWPVVTGAIDLTGLARDRDQLWAEAAYCEDQNYSLILPEELWPAAQVEQEARLEDDPWLELLSTVRGQPTGRLERVMTMDLLLKLEISPERQQQYHLKRIAAVMRKLGWEGPNKFKMGGRVVRGYERAHDGRQDKMIDPSPEVAW
jgi:predicted P-loop ATPase